MDFKASNIPNEAVAREVYDLVGGYRVDLAAGEDFDLFARIGLKARVRFASASWNRSTTAF